MLRLKCRKSKIYWKHICWANDSWVKIEFRKERVPDSSAGSPRAIRWSSVASWRYPFELSGCLPQLMEVVCVIRQRERESPLRNCHDAVLLYRLMQKFTQSFNHSRCSFSASASTNIYISEYVFSPLPTSNPEFSTSCMQHIFFKIPPPKSPQFLDRACRGFREKSPSDGFYR